MQHTIETYKGSIRISRLWILLRMCDGSVDEADAVVEGRGFLLEEAVGGCFLFLLLIFLREHHHHHCHGCGNRANRSLLDSARLCLVTVSERLSLWVSAITLERRNSETQRRKYRIELGRVGFTSRNGPQFIRNYKFSLKTWQNSFLHNVNVCFLPLSPSQVSRSRSIDHLFQLYIEPLWCCNVFCCIFLKVVSFGLVLVFS